MDIRELAEKHLREKLLPFWEKLKDEENGGFYGYMDFDLNVDKKSVKGCILNSRILWFFSNAYRMFQDERLASDARHAYEFMKNYCVDRDYGGVYWSVSYDGRVIDSTKHTYNQAFAIYALASYYDAVGSEEALRLALQIQSVIEEKCTDEWGYLEAFNRRFEPEDNDKLSENGVMAEKTMNTLLHVMEAYTEYLLACREAGTPESAMAERTEAVSGHESSAAGQEGAVIEDTGAGQEKGGLCPHEKIVEAKLRWILNLVETRIYNPELRRQEVFFDLAMNSLIDLHSYGHDIEAAWLIDRRLVDMAAQHQIRMNLFLQNGGPFAVDFLFDVEWRLELSGERIVDDHKPIAHTLLIIFHIQNPDLASNADLVEIHFVLHNDLRIFQDFFQLLNPGLNIPLFILGGIIFRIFR